jgi:hypothetical protein
MGLTYVLNISQINFVLILQVNLLKISLLKK